MNLFHVSKYPNIKTLIPKQPMHWLVRHGLEEGKTPRISFATSIDRCLRAVQSRPGTTYYVYVPVAIDRQYLKRPSRYEVPDARLTNEYWYLKPVNVRLYGVIKSGELIDARVFRLDPDVSTAFGLSHGRKFEYLKRFNKRGREMKIGHSDGLFDLVGGKLLGSGSNAREKAKEWRRGYEEYEQDEDEQREVNRRRERQKSKKKARIALAKILLGRVF